MNDTQKRIKNPATLVQLGHALRQRRDALKLPQSRVDGMRQATVSKIENGGDVTLDTLVSYATALGLEVTLAPIGQGGHWQPMSRARPATPLDLLEEFDDLRDET